MQSVGNQRRRYHGTNDQNKLHLRHYQKPILYHCIQPSILLRMWKLHRTNTFIAWEESGYEQVTRRKEYDWSLELIFAADMIAENTAFCALYAWCLTTVYVLGNEEVSIERSWDSPTWWNMSASILEHEFLSEIHISTLISQSLEKMIWEHFEGWLLPCTMLMRLRKQIIISLRLKDLCFMMQAPVLIWMSPFYTNHHPARNDCDQWTYIAWN